MLAVAGVGLDDALKLLPKSCLLVRRIRLNRSMGRNHMQENGP